MASGTSYQEIFWGLKDEWWKQVYDGRYHSYGPDVFDKGLHREHIEPGYYNSIRAASEYASEELGKTLTVEMYTKIHAIACSHFAEVKRSERNVSDADIYKLRDVNCRCGVELSYYTTSPEEVTQRSLRRKMAGLANDVQRILSFRHNINLQFLYEKTLATISPEIKAKVLEIINKQEEEDPEFKGLDIEKFLKEGNPQIAIVLQKIKDVREELRSMTVELEITKPLIDIELIDSSSPFMRVYYNYENPAHIELVLKLLIDRYNKKISAFSQNPEERTSEENEKILRAIAELYQRLEWLHPFFDGQGRTDLVLLGKLLTENGFNPSILFEPYFSTFEPFEKWVEYLKKGIEAWKETKESLSIGTTQ